MNGNKPPINIGEANCNWKGDAVGYDAIHDWVRHHKGKAKICEYCGKIKTGYGMNWANIDHKYRRKLDDYIALCSSCHAFYDIKLRAKKL